LIIGFHDTVENVRDVFLGHSVVLQQQLHFYYYLRDVWHHLESQATAQTKASASSKPEWNIVLQTSSSKQK